MGTRWSARAAIGLVAAVPLAMDPGGYFIFLPVKWTIACVLVALGLAVLLLERARLPQPPAVRAWVVLLTIITISAITGIGGLVGWIGYPGRYLGVIAWLVFFGAYALGVSIDAGGRRWVASAAVVVSIPVSVYALAQSAGIDPIVWSESLDVTRARSTLGNAAFLGAYLAMIAPLAARSTIDQRDGRRRRLLHAAAALLASVALVMTQTRGAWLGAVAGFAVVGVLERPRIFGRPRFALAAAAGVVVALVILATVSPVAQRVRSVADPTTATARGRIVQWDRTLDMIGGRPVLGWGPDTYAFAFPRYIDDEFERTVKRDVVPDRAHNVFLDLGAASGVGGVLAYVAVLAAIATAFVRRGSRDPVSAGLAGACAAYLVQLQFSFPVADLDVVFWLLAGLLVAPTDRRRTVSPRWSAPFAAVAVVFAAWGATDMVADRMLRDALGAEADGRSEHAQTSVGRAASVAFLRPQYDQAAGRLYRRIGEASGAASAFARGLDHVRDGRRVMPNDLELQTDEADVLLAWGQVAGSRVRVEEAAKRYEVILDVDRSSSRVHLKLGVAYVLLDRFDAAEREWLRAAELAPRSAAPLENLLRLYEQQGRKSDAADVRDKVERVA